MQRPFSGAFPRNYDPAPVRRAAVELVDAAARGDVAGFERAIRDVAPDGTPGYVLVDLVTELAKMQVEA